MLCNKCLVEDGHKLDCEYAKDFYETRREIIEYMKDVTEEDLDG